MTTQHYTKKQKPTCSRCDARHYNFQPCARPDFVGPRGFSNIAGVEGDYDTKWRVAHGKVGELGPALSRRKFVSGAVRYDRLGLFEKGTE